MSSVQLELPLGDRLPAPPESPPPPEIPKITLPEFTLTENSTPRDIQTWWELMIITVEQERIAAKPRLDIIKSELKSLTGKLTWDQRERKKILRQKQDELGATANAMLGAFQRIFETTLEDFTPSLLAMLRETELKTEDNVLTAADEFWECLQRPDIEHVCQASLRDITRLWHGEKIPLPVA
ncbi:hypothetical protein OH491_24900 [Termitidicoccus mucosus]|uniref:Uncharacterized protein n=1 Tax=Termitidicoccus mucosus TaxID=1184151 RepID=A0A178IQV3_9BACT|nr:hypothetical protein AW736_01635 [Opitutaceae bacterium TSB47]